MHEREENVDWRSHKLKHMFGSEERPVLAQVVGAGRGPLVRAALSAAQRAKRRLRVYAVEKNPNAIVSLQNLIATEG